MKLAPLPPGAPEALLDIQNAVRELSEPTQPGRVFACLQAELRPAADLKHCMAWVSDIPALAVSDGITWINVATGASI